MKDPRIALLVKKWEAKAHALHLTLLQYIALKALAARQLSTN